ncbi:MAG: caspase family protein [Bacteroidetes bacterium]|nr:caspase family protein [Bacteroidota bacterium]
MTYSIANWLILGSLWFLTFALEGTPAFAQSPKRISGKSPMKVIRAGTPQGQAGMKAAPDLIIRDELFVDPDSNNVIDGNERSSIKFRIENIGQGDAKNVKVLVTLKNKQVRGLEFPDSKIIGTIKATEIKEVVIPLYGTFDLSNGIAEFKIEVQEELGFDAYPLEMKIETHPFQPPNIVIADAVFSTEKGGQVRLNTPIQLKILVQNTGKGLAKSIMLNCLLPDANCLPLGESDKFTVERMNPGESREFDYSFIANRRYTGKNIPVRLSLTESYGKYAHDTVVSIGLDQTVVAKNKVVIASIQAPELIISKASLTSDVDKNIPEYPEKDSPKFALLIGNEDYSRYQQGLNTEVNVQYAQNDAQVFRDYLVKSLGYKESNVYLLLDATTGEMNQKIDLISKRVNKSGTDAKLLFYYAGHGLPDEASRIPYLIPVDVTGTNISQGIRLSDIYRKFGESGGRVSIFLDACFTGGARGSGLLAARSVKIKPSEEILNGKMVVFTASSGEQSALPYQKEKHGLFTYYILKKIQQTKGYMTFGDLAIYLQKTVSTASLEINQKEQDPEVLTSTDVSDTWKNWKLK